MYPARLYPMGDGVVPNEVAHGDYHTRLSERFDHARTERRADIIVKMGNPRALKIAG
jgi:hypothetical protein